MRCFRKKDFWRWLYSGGYYPLNPETLLLLKNEFVYRNEVKESIYEGEKHSWNFETIRLDFPIINAFAFSALLHLHDFNEIEENLYLKKGDAYYPLGWFDSHNHEMVFHIDEFYRLFNFLKSSGIEETSYGAYFVYLARFVTLTNEKDAVALYEEVVSWYCGLIGSEQKKTFEIKTHGSYGQKLIGTDFVMKMKTLKGSNNPMNFTINEGITWEQQKNEVITLNGFGAHSLRTNIYNKGLKSPIAIYDVTAAMDNYSFPNDIWNQLLKQITV